MESTRTWKGWVGHGSGPGGKDQLPPDVRAEDDRREAARKERQGRLLCAVCVQIYEYDTMPQGSFPAGSGTGAVYPSSAPASSPVRPPAL